MRGIEWRDGDAVELLGVDKVAVDGLVAAAFGLEGVSSTDQKRLVGHLQDDADVVVAFLLRVGTNKVGVRTCLYNLCCI